jgi:hypothetical protein
MDRRLIAWGWVSALGLALATTAFADDVIGHFGGAPIRIRPWMGTYNLAINLCQLLVLAPLIAGALRLPRGRGQRLALAAFTLAALVIVTMLLFPLVRGTGPWDPDAGDVRILRALVFAPSLLRGVGLALAAAAILRAPVVVLSLQAVDVALILAKWIFTPRAVMACMHPFCAAPLGLLPWLAATAAFLWLSRSTSAAPRAA